MNVFNGSALTANLRGIVLSTIDWPAKGQKLDTFLRSLSPAIQIVCLQETHTTTHTLKDIEWRYNTKWFSFFSHGSTNSRGVAILVRKTFPSAPPTITLADSDGRYIQVFIPVLNTNGIEVASVYAPVIPKEMRRLSKH